MSAHLRLVLVALLAVVVSACGDDDGEGAATLPDRLGKALRITGETPYDASCTAGPGYRGSEVEPSLAVDPLDPAHLVGAWQQDRWPGPGATGIGTGVSRDGGETWSVSGPALTRCSGGPAGTYERATDPWVVVTGDGVAHLAALVFDVTTGRQAIVTSRSLDGGERWSAPVVVASESSRSASLDKESITVDPFRSDVLYVTWDRLAGLDDPDPTHLVGPAWLAHSTDGGQSWEAPRVVYDPGMDAQTIGAVVAVLPDGTLLEMLTRITSASSARPPMDLVVLRSTDGGVVWSQPILVSPLGTVGVVDPGTGAMVRTGSVLASIAVDADTGTAWIAWADARFSGGQRDAVALARSDDGGLTWTSPVRANGAPEAPAFTPVVAASGGEVTVSYYDLRNQSSSDTSQLVATAFVARSADGGSTWGEEQQGEPFDLRLAPNSSGLFVGDYTGLVARAGGFTALFVLTNDADENPTDVFVSPLGAPVAWSR